MSQLQDGCIVSWKSPKELSLSKLRIALSESGFSSDLAKDMAPRSAFARAAKQLDDDRIIRKVQEESDELEFQFTKEYLASGELKYEREYSLYLNKDTGTVRCENAEMQQQAQKLVDHHIETREASDVTRLIQKIFESEKGDLIPIREQGGCYYVPSTHADLVDKIRQLLDTINGKLGVWAISMGAAETKQAVSEATLSHMLSEVDEFRNSIENIDSESKPQVVQRRLERIAILRQKLKNYGPLLMGLAAEVQSAIDSASGDLDRRVNGEEVVPEQVEGDISLPDIIPFDGIDTSSSEEFTAEDDVLLAELNAPILPPPPSSVNLDRIREIVSRPLPPVPVG